MHQEEGKAGRRSSPSCRGEVPLSAEGKYAPASPLEREEREVLKESLLVLGPFLGKKKNFWDQDALLRPVRISRCRFMERGMRHRIGSFINVKK